MFYRKSCIRTYLVLIVCFALLATSFNGYAQLSDGQTVSGESNGSTVALLAADTSETIYSVDGVDEKVALSEGFEGTLTDWVKDSTKNLDYKTTTEQAHSGSKSLKIDKVNTGLKSTTFTKGKYRIEWYFYDSTAGADLTTVCQIKSSDSEYSILVGLYKNFTPTKYVYRISKDTTLWTASSITRSIGWHKVTVDMTGTTTNISIDGTSIVTTSAITTADFIAFGDIWGTTNLDGYVDDVKIFRNAPTSKKVSIKNSGDTLIGSYNFEPNTATDNSTYEWLISDSDSGTYSIIPGATEKTYLVPNSDLGKFFKFRVTPKDHSGNIGYKVESLPTGNKPIIKNLALTGTFTLDGTATVGYQYIPAFSESAEGNFIYQWMESNDPNGGFSPILGAQDKTFTQTIRQAKKYLKVRVTPIDMAGVVGEVKESDVKATEISLLNAFKKAVSISDIDYLMQTFSSQFNVGSNYSTLPSAQKRMVHQSILDGISSVNTEHSVIDTINNKTSNLEMARILVDYTPSAEVSIDRAPTAEIEAIGLYTFIKSLLGNPNEDTSAVQKGWYYSETAGGEYRPIPNANGGTYKTEAEYFKRYIKFGVVVKDNNGSSSILKLSNPVQDNTPAYMAMNNISNGGLMTDVLQRYLDDLALRQEYDSCRDKKAIHDALILGKPFSNDQSVKNTIRAVIAKENNVTSGGGSSSGGRSSTVKFTPPVMEPNNVVNISVNFDDLGDTLWAQEAVNDLAKKGYIKGRSDTKFAPNENITREEYVAILIRTFGILDTTAVSTFGDAQAGEWYVPYIATAQKLGLAKGKEDKSFGVGQNITRQEMAVFAYRFAEYAGIKLNQLQEYISFNDDSQIAVYAQKPIVAMVKADIIKGLDGKFEPELNCTRAMAAQVTYGLVKAKK